MKTELHNVATGFKVRRAYMTVFHLYNELHW